MINEMSELINLREKEVITSDEFFELSKRIIKNKQKEKVDIKTPIYKTPYKTPKKIKKREYNMENVHKKMGENLQKLPNRFTNIEATEQIFNEKIPTHALSRTKRQTRLLKAVYNQLNKLYKQGILERTIRFKRDSVGRIVEEFEFIKTTRGKLFNR